MVNLSQTGGPGGPVWSDFTEKPEPDPSVIFRFQRAKRLPPCPENHGCPASLPHSLTPDSIRFAT